jgi:hypothetical protein
MIEEARRLSTSRSFASCRALSTHLPTSPIWSGNVLKGMQLVTDLLADLPASRLLEALVLIHHPGDRLEDPAVTLAVGRIFELVD